MIVVSLQVEALLPGCTSLKEKRMVLRSLTDRLRSRTELAVAEVDFQDKLQHTLLGMACVSGSAAHAQRMLDLAWECILNEDRLLVVEVRDYTVPTDLDKGGGRWYPSSQSKDGDE
jgi:uncharacterized protein YlxP (DUF503 family)